MSSTTITRGNSHETFYMQINITPTQVTNATTSNQTFNVPGLLTTDILVSQGYIANQTSGIFIAECDCLTNGVLTIQFGNFSASPATPQAGIYEIQVVRLEGPAQTNAA